MKENVKITLRIPEDLHCQVNKMACNLDRSLNRQLISLIRTGILLQKQKEKALNELGGEIQGFGSI